MIQSAAIIIVVQLFDAHFIVELLRLLCVQLHIIGTCIIIGHKIVIVIIIHRELVRGAILARFGIVNPLIGHLYCRLRNLEYRFTKIVHSSLLHKILDWNCIYVALSAAAYDYPIVFHFFTFFFVSIFCLYFIVMFLIYLNILQPFNGP